MSWSNLQAGNIAEEWQLVTGVGTEMKVKNKVRLKVAVREGQGEAECSWRKLHCPFLSL